MDNPRALANLIINEFCGDMNLPVLSNKEYEKMDLEKVSEIDFVKNQKEMDEATKIVLE